MTRDLLSCKKRARRWASGLPPSCGRPATRADAGILTEQFRPDVILLDFKLPDVNGNVVCRTIRANPNYEHMRIIVISGVADPDEIRELTAAGADEFIRKPFDINAVIDRVAEMVKVA